MKRKNNIIGYVRYDKAVKDGIRELVNNFEKSQDKQILSDIQVVVSHLQKDIVKHQPKLKGKEIVILFDEEEVSDLTILINSTKSKHNAIGLEIYPCGERAIKF